MNKSPLHLPHRFSVAPMMQRTDRHFRYLARLFSKHCLLYTEMLTTGALLHGDASRFLAFNDCEHPVALQLGGNDPSAMADCAELGEIHGYDEVNINVGCPSDRVQNGMIGACLMAKPELVANCVRAMREKVKIPVTVKSRIGIDQQDRYEDLYAFVSEIANAGCETFIVHARKAWLQGLSPRQNRELPPIKYDLVYRLKEQFPSLTIVINGQIQSIDEALGHLQYVDGVMVGRKAYEQPSMLKTVDEEIFGEAPIMLEETDIVQNYIRYIETQLKTGVPLKVLSRHLLGLFHKQNGAKRWRRHISENAHSENAGAEVIEQALSLFRGRSVERDLIHTN